MNAEDLDRVIGVFTARQVSWVLVGAHAVGLLTEPRATADFDFVVEGRRLDDVISGLAEQFGDLGANDIGAAVQLKSIDIDLIRSNNHPLFQEALLQSRKVGSWNVPRTEVLVVLKFLAALSPWRHKNKRRLDIIDIASIYEAVPALDREFMIGLSRLVYPGAETEFCTLLETLDRGGAISI